MRKLIRAIFVTAGALIFIACSNEQVYNSLQGARENECPKIVDAAQRSQCFDNARTSYDKYEQQRNDARKP